MRKPAKKTDGRANNGGVRKGAGRKPKANEEELLSRLRLMDNIAMIALEKGIKAGNYAYFEKFMQYRWGKPKDQLDITTGGEPFNKPLIDFINTNDKD